jgi:TatA/E family protein of Tat protein translocase
VFFLSPAKLLVVLVVVMIVVGPDRLPQIARQIGSALQSLRQLTSKVEGDLRESMPNLPSTREIAHYTRRPTALLGKLMEMDDDAPSGANDEHLVADPGAQAVIDTGPPMHEDDWPVDHAAPSVASVDDTYDAAEEAGEPPATPAEAVPFGSNGSNGSNGSTNGAANRARQPVVSTADGTPYGDPNMN